MSTNTFMNMQCMINTLLLTKCEVQMHICQLSRIIREFGPDMERISYYTCLSP